MLSGLPIRIRLTLVFAGVIAIVFLGTGSFVHLRVGSSLSRSVNQDLRATRGVASVVRLAKL